MIRLLFFDIPHDKRKCGAAAGIGAALDLGGSLITASSSNKIANKQIAAQQRENELNRAYQTAEAEKARQFNTSERVASQDFSREQMAWQEKMVQQQNEYNSPVNQARMLSEAGLNPAIAMQGQGTTVSASPGSPAGTGAQASSPMPAGVSGLSPVSQQPLDLQIPQMANAVASMLTGIADAKKAGVETDFLQKSLFDRLRSVKADADSKEIGAILLDLDRYVKENIKNASVQKAWSESEKAVYDAVISFNTVGKVKNESAYYAALTDLQKAFKNETDAKTRLIGLEVTSFIPKLDAYLNLTRSQTEENVASAAAKRASVNVHNSMSKLMDIKSDMSELDFKQHKQTFYARVLSEYQQLRHAGLINKELARDIDRNLGRWTWENAKNTVELLQGVVNLVGEP